jgi:hypothetical protein
MTTGTFPSSSFKIVLSWLELICPEFSLNLETFFESSLMILMFRLAGPKVAVIFIYFP